MRYLPFSITIFFLLTTMLALVLFSRAVRRSTVVLGLSVLWMVVQFAIAASGFYLVTKTLPPRLLVAIAPPILLIAALFLTSAGRRFLDRMELKGCVLMHTIRIAVEVSLYSLFLYRQVPRLMTFEGGNLDMLIGLSAPLIWWAFNKGRIGRRGLLVWNSIALLSVLNALVRAMLSAPFRFQRFGFAQPTVAILHAPFVLLPAFIVPAVLLCHLATFRKLAAA